VSYTFGMGRFTGIALAVALTAGCATKSKESRTESSPGNSAVGGEGGRDRTLDNSTQDTTKPADSLKQGQQLPVAPPTGGSQSTNKPLDPSANADPNSPKQQARANGLLGNTDVFDDTPIEGDKPKGGKGGDTKVGGSKVQQPGAQPIEGQSAQQVAFQLDTPDAAVKTALDEQKAALTGCRKSGKGVLEIAITVDESGKVTSAKIAASSTLKDKATRDCVLAVVKKLKLDAGVKVTAPLRFTFN